MLNELYQARRINQVTKLYRHLDPRFPGIQVNVSYCQCVKIVIFNSKFSSWVYLDALF